MNRSDSARRTPGEHNYHCSTKAGGACDCVQRIRRSWFGLRRSRIHGARTIILRRAETASTHAAAAEAAGEIHRAAALRGKRAAYREAAQLLQALEFDQRLPGRRRDR